MCWSAGYFNLKPRKSILAQVKPSNALNHHNKHNLCSGLKPGSFFSDTHLQFFHLLPLENLFDLFPHRAYSGLFLNQELSRVSVTGQGVGGVSGCAFPGRGER